ncbi:MAG: extracellular solute-binding protein [Chloroflexota bacterium]
MLKRNAWLVVAVLLCASLVLAACPAPAPSGGDSGDAADSGDAQREIVWMVRTSTTENPWEQEVAIPAFEEANPDITVNLLILDQPDIAVKREAMIAAGEPLHVWSTNWGGDGFASDRHRGLIMDLTPLIERDSVDMSVFIPEVLAIYESEGKQWALPFLTTGSYLFYNMDLFDAAGLDYPTIDWDDESWTWDAALDLATQLTVGYEDPTTATYGWNEGIWPREAIGWMFDAFPWPEDAFETGFAASGMDFTSENAVMAYQSRHDLMYKHNVMPDSAASQGLDALGGAFQSGRVAMNTTGGWGWWVYGSITPDVEGGFCWGVAPLPYGVAGAPDRSTIFTDPWVLTRGLEGQELEDAWSFVKYLISEDGARAYMEATNTPPTQTLLLEEWYSQFECMSPEDVKTVYEGSFRHGLESSNHMIVRHGEINSTWDNLLSPLWDDPTAVAAEVLPDVEAGVNEVLARIAEEDQ